MPLPLGLNHGILLYTMSRTPFYMTHTHPRTLLLGIDAPYNRTSCMDTYFQELESLARTNESHYEIAHFTRLRDIDPAFFLTKGKLEVIRNLCKEHKIEHIIVSEALTAQQERNIEDYLECTVTDRTALILEIFEKTARSAEGKAQVAIALLHHRKSRLAGKGIHLAQQSGATGVRGGSGETLKERERRRIDQDIRKIKRQLSDIQKAHAVRRQQRLKKQVPQTCLIGYTNAGKSTILNTLTHAGVLAEDKLFATLETTTRQLFVNGHQKGVISDTVGFIQQLPHHLIEAFKATLSELKHSDLLLHVIDLSDKNWKDHAQIVHGILEELGVSKELLYVFNKSDLIDPENLEEIEETIALYQPHVVISGHSKEGTAPLISFLANWKNS